MADLPGPDRAVALRYDPERDGAPQVVASGKGETARALIARAREAGVPLYEDPALAAALLALDLWQEIPEALYAAVAEVLVYILQMERQQAGA